LSEISNDTLAAFQDKQLTGQGEQKPPCDQNLLLLERWQQIYEQLVNQQQTKGYKPGWLYYQLLELKPPLTIWQQFARARGYKPGWAKYRFLEQQESEVDLNANSSPF
jgi:hypothetical protein